MTLFLQVRNCMRQAKAALQGLSAAKAFAAKSASCASVEQEGYDDTCIICLDAQRCIQFQPCKHDVTCSACAQLVMAAHQPCPLCRMPILKSIQIA